MILSLSSSLPGFKAFRFHEGLNIVLADKTLKSTEGQTRNSAGKSSVVELIHFLLGADAGKGSFFQKDALIDHTFSGVFKIGQHNIKVERNGREPKKVFVSHADAEKLQVSLVVDKAGPAFLTLERWRQVLGHFWFGLPLDTSGTDFNASFSPTFRSLISYFMRRNRVGGYTVPEKHTEQQQTWDSQVNISYLLGLDWKIPREIEGVRTTEATLKELRRAVKEGALGKIFGTAAEIRPELARVEDRMTRLRCRIQSFEVLESYKEHADIAAASKREMQEISFRLVSLRENLLHLERVVADEKAPVYADIASLYAAAKMELPGVVLKQFEDVRRFQASVVHNRQVNLGRQIADHRRHIQEAEARLSTLDQHRSQVLKLLEGKGAFEDLMQLNEELGGQESTREILNEKLRNAELLEGKRTQLTLVRADLHQRLQDDHKIHEKEIRSAILKIDQSISDTYDDRTGNLVIEATNKGPVFKITIQGGGTRGGIDNMRIFFFDLMLFETASERFNGGPGMVIHDSHLFDGVDNRQTSAALRLGRAAAERLGGQYIVTLNSNDFAQVIDEFNDDLSSTVLDPRLSDIETGGLFGVRFD